MLDPRRPEASERERRLEEILAAFLAAEDAGQPPELEAILIQHPDLADELRAFFDEHDRIGRLAAPLRAVAGEAGIAVEATDREAQSTFATSPRPAGVPSEMTEDLKATVELTTQREADPDATAPVTPDAEVERDPIECGTRVRYFGDYELINELGRGGMGVVYKARQLSLNRPVALKMLQAGILATEDDLRRFQNEAESVAMLDHPHIVPILEVGQYEEQRYFSMKLIGGPSLDRTLGEFTTNSIAAARLVRTVAEAVHHAHQRGILHRDLKPGNVLLDDRGQPHVTDFGLAKRVQADSELTQSGAILGTPAYMAPEQASGKRGSVTTATDVYGLGAILYALLTGRAPFGGESPVETLEKVRERKPEPPSKRNPRVPRDLETVCLKCLEKDPARRYASAEALADDLRRYLSGESILARPVWLATRAWMWCKRNPVLAGLASALLIAGLIVGLGGIAVVAIEGARRREAEARKEAETNFDMAQAAVEDYLTSVSENTLLSQQDSLDIRSLRQDLLNTALKYYMKFVSQRSNDPSLRRQLATAYFHLAEVTQEIGSPLEAIEAFHAAQTIWEALAAAEPKNHELQGRLADSYLAIGKLQESTDNLPGAIRSLADARAILEPLASRHPDVMPYQSSLGECYSRIGMIQSRSDTGDRGLGMLEKAKAIHQSLIGRAPANIRYRNSLAETINILGVVYFKRHDLPAALRSFQEVHDVCQSLLEGITPGPKPVRLLDLLALSHYNIAVIQEQKGQLDEALKSFQQSLEYRSTLATLHPSVTRYKEKLAESYREIAWLQERARQTDNAINSFQKSATVYEDLVRSQPDQASLHSELAISWNLVGHFDDEARRNEAAIPAFKRAVEAQERAVTISRDVDEYKVNLCIYILNLGEQYADLDRVALAFPYYQRAIQIRRQLYVSHPENRAYALALVEALATLGSLQRHDGDSAAARETLGEALEVMEKLATASPGDPALQGRFGAALTQEATSLAALNQPKTALRLLQRAVEILSVVSASPAEEAHAREWLTEALWERARILRASNKGTEAAQSDRARVALWKGKPAAELALLALRQASQAAVIGYGKTRATAGAQAIRELDLSQAAASLRLAIDQGFTDLPMIQSNPDSALLLSRDDLKPLIKRLESHKQPTSPQPSEPSDGRRPEPPSPKTP